MYVIVISSQYVQGPTSGFVDRSVVHIRHEGPNVICGWTWMVSLSMWWNNRRLDNSFIEFNMKAPY